MDDKIYLNRPSLQPLTEFIPYLEKIWDNKWLTKNARYHQALEAALVAFLGVKYIYLFTNYTLAFMLALQCLRITGEVITTPYGFVATTHELYWNDITPVFADIEPQTCNLDPDKIEAAITTKTTSIMPVHVYDNPCNINRIQETADAYGLHLIYDAAQAIDSFYTGYDGVKRPLGSIGHLGAFSFHETKNIQCGEGGMLVVNAPEFFERAEIIWKKGTNRAAFFRGEVDKYGWVDIGSSFLPSEIITAFLWAQLENLDDIQNRRKSIWKAYWEGLDDWAKRTEIKLPHIPNYASNNAHLFYLVLNNLEQRTNFIKKLRNQEILTVFHYLSLHKSPFYQSKHDGRKLQESDRYSNCLVRLPFFVDIQEADQEHIKKVLNEFC